jgi:ATP-dependent DNA helicase PIF1
MSYHNLLNDEQKHALRVIQEGKNLFLTGAGGTGKSHTIKAIVTWAETAGIRCALTAMTGCAALLLGHGAKTLHSWAGIGLARETPHDLATAVSKNKRTAQRWMNTQLLIVDEVSMMTPELLEKLDLVARHVRKRSGIRFGGVQLILVGDFCQLPPVVRGVSGEEQRFVFESATWKTLIDSTVELRQIQRQSDPVFQTLLMEARLGELTSDSIGLLESRMGLPWQDDDIRPTLLFTRNAEVEAVNRTNMEVLDGERRTYEVQTTTMDKPGRTMKSPDEPEVMTALERLDTDAPYDPNLTLCVGAQVMLVTNMDQDRGLVNGSRGVTVGYTLGGLPIVKFLSCTDPVIVDRTSWWLSDYEGIGRSQIPLRIAYALTIHRSQGATLDSALVDVGTSTFEFGQAYVALSRVRSLAGLYVWKLDPRKIRCHPSVKAFYTNLKQQTEPANDGSDAPDDPNPHPNPVPWTLNGLSPAWRTVIEPFLATQTGQRLRDQLVARLAYQTFAPAPEDVFAALRACPEPAAVKVIILGQDPYPTAGHAHGLAFSVRPSVAKLPPSLMNMYKELVADLGLRDPPTTGSLLSWATQGVLLLNTTLTVAVGTPMSHAGLGWEELTVQLLATVLAAAPHVVIVAWGKHAQDRFKVATVRPHMVKHTLLSAPHPSPLSAYTGFFGSRPYSMTNAALKAHGQTEIQWV